MGIPVCVEVHQQKLDAKLAKQKKEEVRENDTRSG